MTQITIIIAIALAAVSGLFIWSLEARAQLKTELKTVKVALNHFKEQSERNDRINHEYNKMLTDNFEQHNARIMRHGMSCATAPTSSTDGEANPPAYGDPYPALSAYEKECRDILNQLTLLQESIQ